MAARKTFLTAEWRKLVLANYPVEASVLRPLLPAHTELDSWNGRHYVSLVGFLFHRVRVRGVSVPFHTSFPEVNLRFYVRYKDATGWKRGVVFVSEIVPKPAITWVANSLFREHYRTLPMKRFERTAGAVLEVGYHWKFSGVWNALEVVADAVPLALPAGSKEEFITEHFWGYSAMDASRCGEYEVAHPRWRIHAVRSARVDCDFGGLYGGAFAELREREPETVHLAEGSEIAVYSKKIISASSV